MAVDVKSKKLHELVDSQAQVGTNRETLASDYEGKELNSLNDTPRAHIRVFDHESDETIGNGRMFFDNIGSGVIEEGMLEGMKVDEQVNVYVTGPAGVWVISSDAELFGVIEVPENVGNLNWAATTGATCTCRVRRRSTARRTLRNRR